MSLNQVKVKKFDYKKLSGLLIFYFVVLILNNTFAQETHQKIGGFSINPKIGFYIDNESGGFTKGAEISAICRNIIYSVEFYHSDELVILGPTPSEYLNNFGIMVGKYNDNQIFRFQYQAGLGSIWGLKRTELVTAGIFSDIYDSEHFFTIGLLTKIGFKIVPLRFLSIGLDLQSNINFEKPVFMPMLSVEIGKLRN